MTSSRSCCRRNRPVSDTRPRSTTRLVRRTRRGYGRRGWRRGRRRGRSRGRCGGDAGGVAGDSGRSACCAQPATIAAIASAARTFEWRCTPVSPSRPLWSTASHASLRRSSALTCAGLALPLVAFIAWPTSALNAFSLPARNSSTDSRLAAMTAVDDRFERAGVGDLLQPSRLDDGVGAPRCRTRTRSTSRRTLPCHLVRDRAVGDAAQQAGESRGCTGASAMSRGAVDGGGHLAHHPVGGQLARCSLAGRGDHGLEIARHRLRLRQHRRVVFGQAVVARRSARASRPAAPASPASHALDPVRRDHQRRQVGVGEVAVVLRVFLAAHRARLAACRGRTGAVACTTLPPSSISSICRRTS